MFSFGNTPVCIKGKVKIQTRLKKALSSMLGPKEKHFVELKVLEFLINHVHLHM